MDEEQGECTYCYDSGRRGCLGLDNTLENVRFELPNRDATFESGIMVKKIWKGVR
jgi:hypothetical protein